jgi:hypothetical protein
MSVISSPLTGPRFNPLEEPIPQARPRATAYVLGVLLIVIIGSATAILFVTPSKNLAFSKANGTTFVVTHVNIWLAAIGLAFGLIGLIFLVSGNTRRLRLIYEFTASAAELTAVLVQMPAERRALEEEHRRQEDYRRHQYIARLGSYENALLKLGAYEQALQVSRWITQSGGRLPYDLSD